MVDGPSSTSSPSRWSTAIRARRSPSRVGRALAEPGAALVRRAQPGRRDADRGRRRPQRRSPRRRRDARSAAQLAHAASDADPLRSGSHFADSPASSPTGAGRRAGSMSRSARQHGRGDPPPDAGLGGAQHPVERRDRFPRPAGLPPASACATSISARRRTAARCAATTAPPSPPSRSSPPWCSPPPASTSSTFHRLGQPAGAGSGAAQGARRPAPAARRPVPRRIPARRDRRDADRARPRSSCCSRLTRPSSMRTSRSPIWAAAGCCCRSSAWSC